MVFSPTTEGLLNLGSSLPLVVLGVVLLRLRPRRTENAFFGLFAVAWGLQVACVSAGRLTTDPDLYAVFFRLNLGLALPAAFFLAYFASLHPTRNGIARNALGPWLLLGLALPGAVTLLVSPQSILETVGLVDGRPSPRHGGLSVPLVFAPFYAAFYYALAVQFLAARRDESGVAGKRARAVFLALGLFVAYVTARQLAVWAFSNPLREAQRGVVALENAVLFGLGFLLVAAMVFVLLARPGRAGIDVPMVLSLAVPALVGGTEGALDAFRIHFESLGLWRIGTVALVVYSVARFQLFDLDVRLRRAAVAGVPAGLLVVTGLVVGAVAWGGNTGWPLALVGVGGVVANAATWQFRRPLTDHLLPSSAADPEYLYHRRLEVYRGALERILADDASARADDPRLRDMRRTLGLSDREHEIIEFVVRRELGSRGLPPGTPARAEPGARLLDRYRVERLLGEGAHGRAYLAYDESSDTPVVIKAVGTALLGGRAARMLLREARIAGGLRHPHLVAIHDVVEGPEEALIIMEYADGGSLWGLLQRRGSLPLAESVRLLDEVLAGLEAAHAKGIVHRDIKPENILLMRNGSAKLADFGVAREDRPDATAGLTQGGPVGTLLYMSPEQVRGAHVDARSDLYAAAVVFHQMVTGRFYLRVAGRDDFQLRQAILKGAPQLRLGNQPAWLATFLGRALAKDPARRFPSAADMRRALGG